MQMADIFQCHTSHPIFPATDPLSFGQLWKEGRNDYFQVTLENKKILINTVLAGNFLCVYNCIFWRYDNENLVPSPKRSEARGDLIAKTHCESRDADSQSFRTVRICQNGRKMTILYHQTGNWIDALSRSTDQPRLECCEGRNGTIIYIRALQDHSQGVAINPDQFSFKQKPLHWKEHRLHTGNSSSCKSILENGL